MLDAQTRAVLYQLAGELEEGPPVWKAIAARLNKLAKSEGGDLIKTAHAITIADRNEIQGFINRDRSLAHALDEAAVAKAEERMKAAFRTEAESSRADAREKEVALGALEELARLAARFAAIHKANAR